MHKLQKNRNFRKYKSDNGTYTYVITVDGERVEVSEEVYTAYAEIGHKMERMEHSVKCSRILRDQDCKTVRDEHGYPVMLPEREISLEKLIDEDWDFVSPEPSPEDALFSLFNMEIEELHRCISLLTESEQHLINALFFKGLTEQEYAETQGVKRQSINERKLRILKKIKKLWVYPC